MLGLKHEHCYLVGGLTFGRGYKNLLQWGSTEKIIFPLGGDEQIFG